MRKPQLGFEVGDASVEEAELTVARAELVETMAAARMVAVMAHEDGITEVDLARDLGVDAPAHYAGGSAKPERGWTPSTRVQHLPGASDITLTVSNYGDRPILDVAYDNEMVKVEGYPAARFIPQLLWATVVLPNRDNPSGYTFQVRPADGPTQEIMQHLPMDHPIAATVSFTDANNNRWQTTFEFRTRQATLGDGSGSTITQGSMQHISLT